MIVKELAPDEQPRERALLYGIGSLSNADLLAIILRTGMTGYPVTEICRDIMRMNQNLFINLERRSRNELMELKGIGELKALQVEAIMEIVRRYSRESIGDRVKISSADDIYALMKPDIANLPHEEMWAVFLNRSNMVLGRMRVSSGSSTATVFDLKKIVRNALLERAEAVILCHNHPSGQLRPSGPDDAITRKFKEACFALDLTFLDHLIISTEGYYSYSNESSIIR